MCVDRFILTKFVTSRKLNMFFYKYIDLHYLEILSRNLSKFNPSKLHKKCLHLSLLFVLNNFCAKLLTQIDYTGLQIMGLYLLLENERSFLG